MAIGAVVHSSGYFCRLPRLSVTWRARRMLMHVRAKLGRIPSEDIPTVPETAKKARWESAIGAKTGTPEWVPLLAFSIEGVLNGVPLLGPPRRTLFWDPI